MKKRLWFNVMMIMVISLLSACGKDKADDNSQPVIEGELQTTKEEDKSIDNGIVEEERPDTEKKDINTESKDSNSELVVDEVEKEEESVIVEGEIEDISSSELVKRMKIGWNLGNTLDATGGNSLATESSWGNPLTTKEMIDTVKDAGFNVLRIPTTWEKHLGTEPDYIIDESWLDRVQEVVNYGIQNDMYVILNMHHEEWHFPSHDNAEKAKEILTKVWKQIADRFENYDEHLIFEGMNEPRMKGTEFEWNGGNEEGWDVINQLNAAFIETIRSAGGNNSKRHLMIPTYAASSDPRSWQKFEVPEDDKVIVSLHAYTPYNFALNGQGTDVWSLNNSNDTGEVDRLMNNIDRSFTSKGIPVILGEFGARDKNNIESRAAWAEYYIKKASEIGVPCIWWDNGAFSGNGELFGLLARRRVAWTHVDIIDALMRGIE
ncbi:MAG: glycoside hydrolase family 5 protein [Clostridiales bacterium]|nr:glycoside hydrolase family 5 protein [Clostridiales bacterium]